MLKYTDYKLYTCRLVGCLLKLQLRVIPDSSDSTNSISLASKVNNITTVVGFLASEFPGWSWKTLIGIPMLDIGIPM